MKKTKLTMLVATILCVVAVCACLMTGCGDKKDEAVDYSKYTYEDFAKITQAQWEAKTIEHQYYNIEGHNGNSMGNWYSLVNLYSDGSMIYLDGFDTGERPKDWIWADVDHNIRWVYYGYWQVSDGTLKTLDGDTVDKDNILMTYMRWWDKALEEDDTNPLTQDACVVQVEVWASDDYAIDSNVLAKCFTSNGKGFTETAAVEFTDSKPVKYATFKSWYDAWKDQIQEPSAGPPGAGEQPPASDEDIGS